MQAIADEDLAWLAALEERLHADIGTPLRRRTVDRLWTLRLLRDAEAELLAGVLLWPELSARQLETVRDIHARLLDRIAALRAP